MIPAKLKKGDGVRVITPARSLTMPWINEELKKTAIKRFEELGLNLSFGKHVNEIDEFCSSSIESRVEDLHDAFTDDSVKLIITVIGGFNSNQLLDYIDYDLIKKHPKIICGYSDITALLNAIYAKTGLVTYSGPQFFSFGNKKGFEYTLEYFKKCLMTKEPFKVEPPKKWSDDRWANNQENRNFFENNGYWMMNEGKSKGKIIGSNLCTFNLLQGTKFMPKINSSILFLEDDYESQPHTFDRDLQSVIHLKGFEKVRGIVIGKFQRESKMTKELLTNIIKSKKELDNIPIIANVDFGHTTPQITIPIGGTAKISAKKDDCKIEILKH
ncbi:MAG: LD-carboxypeptidase [Nanoarchaeota archaeon]|nr:LD-carboxypeptidase [Nanoarchaeota archaeon]MBU1270484.1 LD-carboxypeptidase [Nanoarchaeota archaeon]MBU1603697.1 LD-carboxypeptidase [Nanoarchaeota archaeon]MBU2443876.1 LD-carboxypeptidase [Nanoarchaeota archaeon]